MQRSTYAACARAILEADALARADQPSVTAERAVTAAGASAATAADVTRGATDTPEWKAHDLTGGWENLRRDWGPFRAKKSLGLGARPPGFIEPCLPTLSRVVPTGTRWAFEIKADGYRFVARRGDDRVRVFSRNAKDWTGRVPAIVETMLALPVTSATLDGEGVGHDFERVLDWAELSARY